MRKWIQRKFPDMERINQDIWEVAVVSTWFGIFIMVIFEPAPVGEPALGILVRGIVQLPMSFVLDLNVQATGTTTLTI